MRRAVLTALALGALLIGTRNGLAQAKASPVTPRLQAALERYNPRNARAGVVVRRLSDGAEVFSHRGGELFEIASNTKLFTTAAALWRLGPDYEFRTPLVADGKIEAGALKGNLVVVGSGDPGFSSRNGTHAMYVPHQMAVAVTGAGIREVSGDLVMDDRLFDRVYRAPGWPAAEALWWYAAPVSALSFNDNCVEVKVSAGGGLGAPTTISMIPIPGPVRLVNQVVTVGRNVEGEVSFERRADGAIEITGKLPVGGSRSETLAVDSPALFLGAAIRSELEKAGVRLAGTVRLVGDGEKLREGAMEVFVWKSRLVDAVAVANRRSQNFYAEQILKTLGAARSGQGSFQNGAAAVLDFAKAAHLPESTVSVTDGCGLGPDNKATPQAIAALLEVVYRSRIQGAFYNSLAVNGEAETTLRNRMGESGMRGRIHAKTGTIKSGGISALSGYATALDGEAYSFSVLCNGFNPGGLCQARELEDAVCYAIVGEKPAPRTK